MSQEDHGSSAPPPPSRSSRPHLPWIAALLSFLIPGIGQIYNQQTAKGAVFIVVSVVGWTMTWLLMYVCVGILLLPIMLGVWVVAIVDAAMVGQKIADGQQVEEWDFF